MISTTLRTNIKPRISLLIVGMVLAFALGNVIKYAKRYGRKGNAKEARKDLMKILHYAVIQLYIHDEENKTKFVNDQHEHGYPEYDGKLAPGHHMRLNDVSPDEWDRVNRVKGAPLCG